MVERLALLLALGAAAVGAYHLLRQLHLRRMAPAPAAGRPTLLYFHADHCPACPAQGRAVDQTAAQWGERLLVQRIDAARDPETAAHYRVFTLPTTVLVDGGGQVQAVNYGLTAAHKLGRQVAALARPPPAADGPRTAASRQTTAHSPLAVVRRLSSVVPDSTHTTKGSL